MPLIVIVVPGQPLEGVKVEIVALATVGGVHLKIRPSEGIDLVAF